jgi:ubiquinone/menaquinone biosynthesis C-methylase UbiE
MEFQRKYFAEAVQDEDNPVVLNVGCADDPVGLGDSAMHVDLDDWSYRHKHFTQSDASELPFGDRSYSLVICGDVLEHVVKPEQVVSELCRVCSGTLVLTIFEEWRLPGPGQWIKEGQKSGDVESVRLGYADREDYQIKVYPQRKGFDDNLVPHLIHINQFTNEDIQQMIAFVMTQGFYPLELLKSPEATENGHTWYNWLLAFKREGVS